jgi:hypothetical protein
MYQNMLVIVRKNNIFAKILAKITVDLCRGIDKKGESHQNAEQNEREL